ncbi:MAG: hypothetical protein HY461_01670 [Parcubacteria group bacterium]|nr:hypothetical protein [Parcubacteria group bacterium]
MVFKALFDKFWNSSNRVSEEESQIKSSFLQLKNPDERVRAALKMGRDRKSEIPLVQALREENNPRVFSAILVALEKLNNPGLVDRIIEIIPHVQDPFYLHEVSGLLWKLSGKEPLLPLGDPVPHEVYKAWKPVVSSSYIPYVEITSSYAWGTTFNPLNTSGKLSLYWLSSEDERRWDRGWWFSEKLLYDIGNSCGTCDMILRFCGYPQTRIAATSESLGNAVNQRAFPDASWLKTWLPVISNLRVGHYVAGVLESVPVQRITKEMVRYSWLTIRKKLKAVDIPSGSTSSQLAGTPGRAGDETWLGVDHWQSTVALGSSKVFTVFLPTQEMASINEDRVNFFVERIKAGDRPTVVCTGWFDERSVGGDHDEKFLVLAILDGHHKMAAYEKAGVPARIIALCREEDCWGNPEDRTAALKNLLAELRGS